MQKFNFATETGFRVLKSTNRSQVAAMTLTPGNSTGGPTNQHPNSDQWVYVLAGTGKAIINQKEIKLETGELLLIEAKENHEIISDGSEPLQTFSIYTPTVY